MLPDLTMMGLLTYSGHGHHEEIDTVPVGKAPHPVYLVIVTEIWGVAAILKLQQNKNIQQNK